MTWRCPALVAAFVAGALAQPACRSEGPTAACSSGDGAAIDPPTMAFLSLARALHHEADIDESSGNVDGALAALDRLIKTPAPRAAEVEEVVADAYARLAELRLKKNDFPGAEEDVHTGLEHARGPTYFRGHLLEVAGLVAEARAHALSDAGKTEEAQQARGRAIGLLEEAVRVQRQVVEQALGDTGAHD
jgi:tetratricopeptide (TPR) repeat protein